MLDILGRIFAGSPTPETARIITEVQREAHFRSHDFELSTLKLDPEGPTPEAIETASLEDLETAICDCRDFWRYAYPEPPDQDAQAIRINRAAREALQRRYGRHGDLLEPIYARIGYD